MSDYPLDNNSLPEEQDQELIVIDSDTIEDENNESGGLYPYDPTKADIDIREDPQTVFELMRKYDRGMLIINPDFQRNLVWNIEKKSKFIESVILNFPLPPWYVNQTTDGKYIVVDGLQRTTALHGFINDEFQLRGLQALPKLNGKVFKQLLELEGNYQTRIEDKKLNLYVIKPSVPIKVVHDIFNRINTGGTILQRQEVRNCIFLGEATKLLKELSEEDYFRRAIDNGVSPRRMKDREVVLRYLAFKILDYEKDYQGDMSDFLENAMRRINLMSDEERNKLKEDFKRVMTLTHDFFGKYNFRLPTQSTRGKISLAVFESVSYFFSIKEDAFLKDHKEKITKNYFVELLQDQEFLDAVKSATNSKTKVQARFGSVQRVLGSV